MDNIHEVGKDGEVKKLPEDPQKIKAIIAERVKILLAKIAEKLKK